MCTVSFIARKHGYALAMNRDEKLSRAKGLPPKRHTIASRTILAPTEPGGGMWIALNDVGVTFALINWYAIPLRPAARTVSRGEVVSAVCAASSPAATQLILNQLPLPRMNAFRLIGIFPASQKIIQWQWNLKKLVRRTHRWEPQIWISSGFDEPVAQRIRSETFQQARQQKSAGSLGWLRRLHSSQKPEPGPFAICMRRADAATVSYTETVVDSSEAVMRHQNAAPNAGGKTFRLAINLNC